MPPDAPLTPTPEAAILRPIYGGLVLLFLIGAALQAFWLRRTLRESPRPSA